MDQVMERAELQTAMNEIGVGDYLELSIIERQALEFYDQLRQVTLEYHYLHALITSSQATRNASPATVEDVEAARLDLLDAKARYTSRNNIEEAILTSVPIIQAVHASHDPSPIARDLLTLIEVRDGLSLTETNGSVQVLDTRATILATQSEHAGVMRHNVELAKTMMDIADELDDTRKEDVQDVNVRLQIENLEKEVTLSRQRWRLMKGVVSSIIAGSGVDWVKDHSLRSLVLDAEDDEDE